MTSSLSSAFVARLAREHQACAVPIGIGPRAEEFALATLGVLFAHHAVSPHRDEASLAAAIDTFRSANRLLVDPPTTLTP